MSDNLRIVVLQNKLRVDERSSEEMEGRKGGAAANLQSSKSCWLPKSRNGTRINPYLNHRSVGEIRIGEGLREIGDKIKGTFPRFEASFEDYRNISLCLTNDNPEFQANEPS